MRAFVGILLLSGYNIRSSEKDYWDEADDLKAECIQNLPKNRYLKLKASLHFADNSLASQSYSDRAFKIRPLLDLLNRNFLQFGVFSSKLSIVEMIIRYYGHHGLKQFIRGKPIRRIWTPHPGNVTAEKVSEGSAHRQANLLLLQMQHHSLPSLLPPISHSLTLRQYECHLRPASYIYRTVYISVNVTIFC